MSDAFSVGDCVKVQTLPPYYKTADPMPMLRPPNVIKLGEKGIIMDRRPGGYWVVHFARGAYLLDSQYLALVSEEEAVTNAETTAEENASQHSEA